MATFLIIIVVASLLVFIVVGLVAGYQALRRGFAEHRARSGPAKPQSWNARVRDYVGATSPEDRPLTPPARVACEFVAGCCGFPGLGWMLSGALFAGLVMMAVVPAIVWGFYPVYLAVTGGLLGSPFAAVWYLPLLGLGSALALTIREVLVARRLRGQ